MSRNPENEACLLWLDISFNPRIEYLGTRDKVKLMDGFLDWALPDEFHRIPLFETLHLIMQNRRSNASTTQPGTSSAAETSATVAESSTRASPRLPSTSTTEATPPTTFSSTTFLPYRRDLAISCVSIDLPNKKRTAIREESSLPVLRRETAHPIAIHNLHIMASPPTPTNKAVSNTKNNKQYL